MSSGLWLGCSGSLCLTNSKSEQYSMSPFKSHILYVISDHVLRKSLLLSMNPVCSNTTFTNGNTSLPPTETFPLLRLIAGLNDIKSSQEAVSAQHLLVIIIAVFKYQEMYITVLNKIGGRCHKLSATLMFFVVFRNGGGGGRNENLNQHHLVK